MSAETVKENIEKILAEAHDLMDLKANDYILPHNILKKAIILTVGGDPRTIKKYIDLMFTLEYISRNNQFAYIVLQRRL